MKLDERIQDLEAAQAQDSAARQERASLIARAQREIETIDRNMALRAGRLLELKRLKEQEQGEDG